MELSAVLAPAREGANVAYNPKTDTTIHGETVEDGLENLRKGNELSLEEFPMSISFEPLPCSFTGDWFVRFRNSKKYPAN